MLSLPPHLSRILNLARWAPSGDNTQPWRFEILGAEHILVHGFDTRETVVYDLDGHASQLAIGALLENLTIAASAEKRATTIQRRPGTADTQLQFDIYFRPENVEAHPLLPYIETRVVQRRPMSTQPLSAEHKEKLAQALPEGYTVVWHEGLAQRWLLAKFVFDNAKVRLTIPEAYQVHRSVIEWGAQFSPDKIPEQAVGIGPPTARLMRWVMASWERVSFFNTYFAGHLPPRLQLDLWPGLRCGAHFTLAAPADVTSVDDYVAAGQVMQRFWLTTTQLNWLIQPEMTPIIFARYHRRNTEFTGQAAALAKAGLLNQRLQGIVGATQVEQVFFMGRIGLGATPLARSIRQPLEKLLIENPVPN
jgi:hypothetical protein